MNRLFFIGLFMAITGAIAGVVLAFGGLVDWFVVTPLFQLILALVHLYVVIGLYLFAVKADRPL